MHLNEKNQLNQNKYNITAWFYDILDYPWELQYRKWRPSLVGGMHGEVLEAGVGTGRNLKYYQADINLTALDFSPRMLRRAVKRARKAVCGIRFVHEDPAAWNQFRPTITIGFLQLSYVALSLMNFSNQRLSSL